MDFFFNGTIHSGGLDRFQLRSTTSPMSRWDNQKLLNLKGLGPQLWDEYLRTTSRKEKTVHPTHGTPIRLTPGKVPTQERKIKETLITHKTREVTNLAPR